jgi:hypothetical protein
MTSPLDSYSAEMLPSDHLYPLMLVPGNRYFALSKTRGSERVFLAVPVSFLCGRLMRNTKLAERRLVAHNPSLARQASVDSK